MLSPLRPAVTLLTAFMLITGIAYPLLVTGIAQTVFPAQANGSLIDDGDAVRGSSLICQSFTDPQNFWNRPSATAPMPCNAAASSGSNLGLANPALLEAVKARVAALRAADPGNTAAIPADLVTASGSGLDPHISPAAAEYQIARVARARGMTIESVQALVSRHTAGRQFALLGEPRVNVVALNRALDTIP
ncbi:MAG: potassium-transporting ATPase subunit KdpC [Burkholderiales bacterium]|nr:potassium-transporting ATPase subunit KdpC [Burkholderiales bacterium]